MRRYEEFEDARIKHLDLIQAVITRLGNDGFLLKGWALTIAGAFFGFAVNDHDRWLAVASALPTLTFWGLDAYFLRSERLFRKLYGRVRAFDPDIEPFFMSATSDAFLKTLSAEESSELAWKHTLRRPALAWFYGVILVAALLTVLIVAARPINREPAHHHRSHSLNHRPHHQVPSTQLSPK